MPRPLPRRRPAPRHSPAPGLALLAAGLALLLALPLLPLGLAYGMAWLATLPPYALPLLPPAVCFVVAGLGLALWR